MKLRFLSMLLLPVLLLPMVGCSKSVPCETTTAPSTENLTVPPTEPSTEIPEEPSTEIPEEPSTEEPSTETPEEPSKEEAQPLEKREYSILFIGNSYTHTNKMSTDIFAKFAKAGGYPVKVVSITKNAYTLQQFADPADTYGAQVETALTGTKKYDFVFLQEQSVRPAGSTAPDFYAAVRNLTERIRATGAIPVLYSTWGRKEGNSTLDKYGWTNTSMTWKLAAGYQAIGDELEIPVAHAGLAFYDVYTNHSDIEIYHTDKSHPSYEGSYLAAATLFGKIFNADPTGVDYNGTLSEETASILREAARKAVFETPSIPDEYLTMSEGIG